jgi:tripartite-type tricarboxylate transporter receptor subunit TctC
MQLKLRYRREVVIHWFALKKSASKHRRNSIPTRLMMWSSPTGMARSVYLAALVLAALPASSLGEGSYPSRTVKIVVPLPPGPAADVLPRILADKLASKWGRPVIVENRPGAAQNLGAEVVARAEPDGHTLLATPSTPLVISQNFYPKLAFDPNAFVPISIFAETTYVLVVNPKVAISTLQELIAFAKANPDRISFASAGIGSGPHLTVEMLKLAASARMNHVPYKGLGPAMTDLLAGHIDMMIDNLGNTLPLIREGKLRALAVADKGRVAELPDVPAIAEVFPGFYSAAWFGMVAPPRTPPDIAARISLAVAEVLRLPDVTERFLGFSIKPVGTTPAETAVFLRQETERWRKVIVAGGLKSQ